MTAHADGRFVGRRRRLAVLDAAGVERIHEAALELLAETGVMFHAPDALRVLAEHGAQVDAASTVARLPRELVERALATLPRHVTLGARDPAFDLPLDGEHLYVTSDGCATRVREADGSVRTSRKQDVYDAARVVDRLDGFSATSALVSAQDCPEDTRVLHEFDACVRASRKHTVVVSVKDAREAACLIRMAEAVQGGRERLRARPLFSCIVCTVSPLHQERFGMELAFTLADAGIPSLIYPMPILGATAPVTPAGAAVVGAAEVLAAVTAVQLYRPGAPLVHAGGPTALHMRTGDYFANVPEALLLRALQAQMAARWGLPAGIGWGGTKDKQPGAQAAYENTLGLLVECFAGADLLFGAGLLDSVQMMSLEELVIADETVEMATRLVRGVAVDDERLAVELVQRTGFEGGYLSAAHTRAHARDLWRPRLGESGTFDAWRAAGAPSTADTARRRVDDILAAAETPFPDDLAREFDQIILAAERAAP